MSVLLDALNWIRDHISDHPVVLPTATQAQPYGNVGVTVVRDGYSVAPLPVAPSYVPRRFHDFATVDSFAAFLTRHFTPACTEILADQGEGKIVAWASPDWNADRVTCSLPRSAKYKAWTAAFGKTFTQKDLYRFLVSHRDEIEDGGSVLSGLRTMEIVKTGSLKGNLNEQGVYEFVGATEGTDIRGRLPTRLRINIPLYQGSKSYDIDIDVVVDTANQTPTFTLAPLSIDDVLEQAWCDEVYALTLALGPPVRANSPTPGPGTLDNTGFLVSRGKSSRECAPKPASAEVK